MLLNVDKTNYILFRRISTKYNDEYNLSINNTILERKRSVVLLGLHLDEFLNWDTHFKHVKNKLISANYVLSKLKHSLSKHHLKMIYHAIFQSHINYGCMLWFNTKKSNLNYISKLQMKAVKHINHGKTTTLAKENLLSVNDLNKLSLLNFMHRISSNSISENIKCLFTLNNEVHSYSTRQANAPHIPKYNYQQTINSFIHQAPMNWITLPHELKTLAPSTFKRRIKKYLSNNRYI